MCAYTYIHANKQRCTCIQTHSHIDMYMSIYVYLCVWFMHAQRHTEYKLPNQNTFRHMHKRTRCYIHRGTRPVQKIFEQHGVDASVCVCIHVYVYIRVCGWVNVHVYTMCQIPSQTKLFCVVSLQYTHTHIQCILIQVHTHKNYAQNIIVRRTANLIIIDVRYPLSTVFSTSLLLENR
jgi:hypothetical protein